MESARDCTGFRKVSLTYDDAGNLVQDGSSEGDHKYYYDYRNRLIEVQELQSSTWTTVAEYKYDALNRRIVAPPGRRGRFEQGRPERDDALHLGRCRRLAVPRRKRR